MRFTVYPDGCGSRAVTITATSPDRAAKIYAEEHSDSRDGDAHLVVTPSDDAAKELPGWMSDAEEPQHRLFVVEPVIVDTEWTTRRVTSFRGEEAGQ